MNVLLINGSPRGDRSNSLILSRAFCQGLMQESDYFKELPVYKMHIEDCRGCYACWKSTPGKCCILDDMPEIIDDILWADIIIWSFPLYYFSLPSRLKALIDRTLPMNLPFMKKEAESGGHPGRYDLSGKRYVCISTCGFYTAEGNYQSVDAQFSKMFNKIDCTTIYCGQGELFKIPALSKRTGQYLEYVKKAGQQFRNGGISPDTWSHLEELLYPRDVFEQIADASWGTEAGGNYEAGSSKEPSIKPDEALVLTKQIAALYNKKSWKGQDRVLEFYYTDLDKTYQILMQEKGQKVLAENLRPYTTRIETPFTLWVDIAEGKVSGQHALFEKKYKVRGDVDMMLNWDAYFGGSYDNEYIQDVASTQEQAVNGEKSKASIFFNNKTKKTNMSLILYPWIIIWVLLPNNFMAGGIVGVMVCAAMPFAFLKWRATIFEYISIFAVGLVSLAAVLQWLPVVVLIPVSYGLFGLMWTITGFLKIPLTSYYSMNDYGGEQALDNPLFIQTNRILTTAWGVLYLLTPIWTYFLLQGSMSQYAGVINTVLPALMRIFTRWFSKWYLRYYAGK